MRHVMTILAVLAISCASAPKNVPSRENGIIAIDGFEQGFLPIVVFGQVVETLDTSVRVHFFKIVLVEARDATKSRNIAVDKTYSCAPPDQRYCEFKVGDAIKTDALVNKNAVADPLIYMEKLLRDNQENFPPIWLHKN